MTGSYASFKGKLKVGDRVRVRGKIGTISKVAEEWFWLMGDCECGSMSTHWFDADGTLELLTPSAASDDERRAKWPNQEKWWLSETFHNHSACIGFSEGQLCCFEKEDMNRVIAEAERRGMVAAWEEANEMLVLYLGLIDPTDEPLQRLGEIKAIGYLGKTVLAKLAELKKPVTEGK